MIISTFAIFSLLLRKCSNNNNSDLTKQIVQFVFFSISQPLLSESIILLDYQQTIFAWIKLLISLRTRFLCFFRNFPSSPRKKEKKRKGKSPPVAAAAGLCCFGDRGRMEWAGLRAHSRQRIGCAWRQSGSGSALIGWHEAKLQVSCALREAGLGEGDQSPSVYISNHLLHRRLSENLKRVFWGWFFF